MSSDPKNHSPKRPVPISTEEFDRKVEAGEDIDDHLDWENAVTVRPGEFFAEIMLGMQAAEESSGVQDGGHGEADAIFLRIGLPKWAFSQLQDEASRRGLSREDLAQQLIVRQLEREKVPS